jgi:hypothetical protein
MGKVLRFIFCPYQKKKLLGKSLFLIWIIRISLWFFSFKSLNKWLSRFESSDADNGQANWSLISSIVSSVKACSRYVPYASCLTQALATRTLLQMKGQSSQLKIGVDKDEDNKLMAHAWIEVDGRIIIGKVMHHQRYAVLNSYHSKVI